MAAAQSLETIFTEIRHAGRHNRRHRLRRHAARYRRDPATLLTWTFPASRGAVIRAIADPDAAAATRALCRVLWRDLQSARALPPYLAGRPLRIAALRVLFACECACYRRQRDRRRSAEPPLTTGAWLTGLCRAVEAGAAARAGPRRTGVVPRGPGPAADRAAAAAWRQLAGSNPGPSSGHRK